MIRKLIFSIVGIYVKEYYFNVVYGVYLIENDIKVVVVIVVNKYSFYNFWYGFFSFLIFLWYGMLIEGIGMVVGVCFIFMIFC